MPCSRDLSNIRTFEGLPDVRLHACRIVDRPMDPEVLTATGQLLQDEDI